MNTYDVMCAEIIFVSLDLLKTNMIHTLLSSKLNADLADTIIMYSAATTMQTYMRRMLAQRKAERRRTSGEYAFQCVMEGEEINVWMSHTAYMRHIQTGFAKVPTFYFR